MPAGNFSWHWLWIRTTVRVSRLPVRSQLKFKLDKYDHFSDLDLSYICVGKCTEQWHACAAVCHDHFMPDCNEDVACIQNCNREEVHCTYGNLMNSEFISAEILIFYRRFGAVIIIQSARATQIVQTVASTVPMKYVKGRLLPLKSPP